MRVIYGGIIWLVWALRGIVTRSPDESSIHMAPVILQVYEGTSSMINAYVVQNVLIEIGRARCTRRNDIVRPMTSSSVSSATGAFKI